jgi:hypothetical protein
VPGYDQPVPPGQKSDILAQNLARNRPLMRQGEKDRAVALLTRLFDFKLISRIIGYGHN